MELRSNRQKIQGSISGSRHEIHTASFLRFPVPQFHENQIYYFGGTKAIEAGLLTPDEVLASLVEMKRRVELAGAASIGHSYPPHPEGFFEKIMNPEYSYQNRRLGWFWRSHDTAAYQLRFH